MLPKYSCVLNCIISEYQENLDLIMVAFETVTDLDGFRDFR